MVVVNYHIIRATRLLWKRAYTLVIYATSYINEADFIYTSVI